MIQGSLLLTTAPRLEQEPQTGADLVRLLKASGMIGVGVAIMPHVREIPTEMLDAADEVGLPVLRVPEGTPFRQITSYVFNALSSRDTHRLRRSVALQKQLLEVLLAEQSPAGVVRRLGELIDVDTVLLDARGDAVVGSGYGMFDGGGGSFVAAVWGEYRSVFKNAPPRSFMDVRGRKVAFREVRAPGSPDQLLLAVYPESSLISEFADAALTFVQRLLEVELVTGHNVGMVRRRTRRGLLDMLVQPRGNAAELTERLVYHGIEPSEPCCVVALWAEPPCGEQHGLQDAGHAEAFGESLLAALDSVLEEHGTSFLSQRLGDHVLILVPLDAIAKAGDNAAGLIELGEVLASRVRTPSLAVGMSESFVGLDAVPRAAGQARLALHRAQVAGEGTLRMVTFDDLGLRYKALDRLPDEVLRQLKQGVVDRLSRADQTSGTALTVTLEAFLAHGCSVNSAAAALFVHRNTLRKRLGRIEQVLGLDLTTSDGQVEAYLGVHAAEVLATRGT